MGATGLIGGHSKLQRSWGNAQDSPQRRGVGGAPRGEHTWEGQALTDKQELARDTGEDFPRRRKTACEGHGAHVVWRKTGMR